MDNKNTINDGAENNSATGWEEVASMAGQQGAEKVDASGENLERKQNLFNKLESKFDAKGKAWAKRGVIAVCCAGIIMSSIGLGTAVKNYVAEKDNRQQVYEMITENNAGSGVKLPEGIVPMGETSDFDTTNSEALITVESRDEGKEDDRRPGSAVQDAAIPSNAKEIDGVYYVGNPSEEDIRNGTATTWNPSTKGRDPNSTPEVISDHEPETPDEADPRTKAGEDVELSEQERQRVFDMIAENTAGEPKISEGVTPQGPTREAQ